MSLEALTQTAHRAGASDLHVQSARRPMLRVAGRLTPTAKSTSKSDVEAMLRQILRAGEWEAFCARGSLDFSRVLAGVRCRINAMRTLRGIGLAIRLLGRTQPTLAELNLHPSLAELAHLEHGLVLISGPTGSGKSSTIAALLREMQDGVARHILTLEQPIEFLFDSDTSLVRQREVGQDTPSFSQGLIDAMREDPDVIVVGEIRDPESMRLALDAAETGHLVLTTIHSSNVSEALGRITSAFPAEIQALVCAQLADCLAAVVSQSLRYRPDLRLRIPECEILRGTTPARSLIRKGDFFRMESVLQTGAADGQWSRQRYRSWLQHKTDFQRPRTSSAHAQPDGPAPEEARDETPVALPPIAKASPSDPRPEGVPPPELTTHDDKATEEDVIVIEAPTGTIEDILEELDE